MITAPASRPVVLSLGFVALDVILFGGEIRHRAGGTASNVAANLAIFGWSASVAALLGSDAAGQALLSDLNRASVDTTSVIVADSVVTPLVIHEITDTGHRFRFGCPDCGRKFPRRRPLSRDRLEAILSCHPAPDVFFFDRPDAVAVALAAKYRKAGCLVMFEPSTSGHPKLFRAALAEAHIVKYSRERLERFEEHLVPHDPLLTIVTAGAAGLDYRFGGEQWRALPAVEVESLDTGGAGDWLTAVFLARLTQLEPMGLSSGAVRRALRDAQVVAAASCRWPGARGITDAGTARQILAEAGIVAEQPNRPDRKNVSTPVSSSACRSCLAASA